MYLEHLNYRAQGRSRKKLKLYKTIKIREKQNITLFSKSLKYENSLIKILLFDTQVRYIVGYTQIPFPEQPCTFQVFVHCLMQSLQLATVISFF